MFIDQVSRYLGFITGMIAVGVALDRLSPSKSRTSIAIYIFGLSDGLKEDFEKSVISSVIGIFFHKNGKFIFQRVFIYSSLCNLFFFFLALSQQETPSLSGLFALIILFTCCVIISIPFDLFSIYISKQIFLQTEKFGVFLLFFITLDIIVSLLPLAALLPLIFNAFLASDIYQESKFLSDLIILTITVSSISNCIATIVNSLLQILITFTGYVFRIIFIVLKINRIFILYSDFHNFPLAFLFFIISIVFIIFELFI